MPEIKYFCFDLGGVANVRTPTYLLLSAARKHWDGFLEEDWERMVFPDYNSRDIWREFQNGVISSEQYLDFAFRKVKVPSTSSNRLIFRSLLEEWCGVPYQPMLDLVDALKQNGYHTSVLSNNNEIMYNTSGAEIKNHVDVAISSHEIGRSKPHWEAYCILLGKIKARVPGEVLFVDDQEKNIQAANNYGLHGYHFRSKAAGMDQAFIDLMMYLEALGLKRFFSSQNSNNKNV